MTTNPIRPPSPPSPESSKDSRADGKKFREEMQKVEKVKEIDPDEQRQRRKQFGAQLGDQDTPDDIGNVGALPSLFDASFHGAPSKAPVSKIPLDRSGKVSARVGVDGAALPPPSPTPVPSPAYSQPPTVQSTPAPQPGASSSALPSSPVFWQSVDTSNNVATPDENFTEYDRTSSFRPAPQNNQNNDTDDNDNNEDYDYVYKPEAEAPAVKVRGKEPSETSPQKTFSTLEEGETLGAATQKTPTAVPGKKGKATPAPSGPASTSQTTASAGKPQTAPSNTNAASTSPSSKTPSSPTPGSTETPPSTAQQETAAPVVSAPQASNLSVPQKPADTAAPVQPVGEKIAPAPSLSDTTAGQDKQDQHEQKGETQVTPGSVLSQFPTDVQPMVQTAASQAASYLSPDTMALFQQMVGSIYVMTSQGISTTEVLLNSPAFANSKFFGSTITIQKFSTAPSDLNIRLSGSTAAVDSFNQNLPSLVAAFEHSRFQFHVRIETAYRVEKADRPVLRRKEKGGDKDSSKEGTK